MNNAKDQNIILYYLENHAVFPYPQPPVPFECPLEWLPKNLRTSGKTFFDSPFDHGPVLHINLGQIDSFHVSMIYEVEAH